MIGRDLKFVLVKYGIEARNLIKLAKVINSCYHIVNGNAAPPVSEFPVPTVGPNC